MAANGKLYGVTEFGGDYGEGTLYEFDLNTNQLTVKVHFETSAKGEFPVGKLLEDGDNIFYGMTYSGGFYGHGVLFEYNANTNSFINHVDFDARGRKAVQQ